MAVIACINAYNEGLMISGCLASLGGQTDRIVVVDGRYQHFPGNEAASIDKTVEIAKAFGAEVILPPNNQPWIDQPTKRSAYLVGKEGDWYFRIDADERLVGELPDFTKLDPTKGHALLMVWPRQTVRSWVVCLFCHRGEMLYDKVHCALWSDGKVVSRRDDCVKLEQPYLVHLSSWRPAERILAKREYYRWQREAERAYRADFRI